MKFASEKYELYSAEFEGSKRSTAKADQLGANLFGGTELETFAKSGGRHSLLDVRAHPIVVSAAGDIQVNSAKLSNGVTKRQFMSIKIRKHLPLILLATSLSGASSAYADSGCTEAVNKQFASANRVVSSLRWDKPAQMRVFSSGGAEFTAGQAQWMKGKLTVVSKACASRDSTTAISNLAEVVDNLTAHHVAL